MFIVRTTHRENVVFFTQIGEFHPCLQVYCLAHKSVNKTGEDPWKFLCPE